MSGDPLGTTSEISVHNSTPAGRKKYRLKNRAGKLLPGRRVARCYRQLVPGTSFVALVRSESAHHAWYQNLFTCGDVWCCPVCAPRIGAERADELKHGLAAAAHLGWTAALLSLTLRHSWSDTLDESRGALNRAVSALKSGRRIREIRQKYGWTGDIRNLEVTVGPSGWHPHCHFLLFFSRRLTPDELADLEQDLYLLWEKKLAAEGYDATYEHGIDLRTADKDIADYVAKFGRQPEGHWGAGDELGRSTSKRGHRDGLTPFELLEASMLSADNKFWKGSGRSVQTPRRAAALFVEFATSFEGAHQLQWSKGLRDLLDIELEQSDQELAEQVPKYADSAVVLTLEPTTWKKILAGELEAELLDYGAGGNQDVILAWLRMNGIHLVDISQYNMPARASPRPSRPRSTVPPAAPTDQQRQSSLYSRREPVNGSDPTTD